MNRPVLKITYFAGINSSARSRLVQKLKELLRAGCLLFKEAIRYTGGCCSVLLMATIISKVTNAINTENSLLITQLAPDPSSARFNHQTARVNKRSIIPQLCSDTQYTNQPICRLSDWTGGYCEIQFTSTQWCT